MPYKTNTFKQWDTSSYYLAASYSCTFNGNEWLTVSSKEFPYQLTPEILGEELLGKR